ncbi:MAG: hypothetical protein LBS59_06700 [Puniceicoccales bacterium]|nr:hypothetical protein [Puniceicoccales bacterium]
MMTTDFAIVTLIVGGATVFLMRHALCNLRRNQSSGFCGKCEKHQRACRIYPHDYHGDKGQKAD